VAILVPKLVQASLDLFRSVSETFLPTAVKWHYAFNVRDLANLFQGMCLSTAQEYKSPALVIRLWAHESERVFSDRLVSDADVSQFISDLVPDIVRKHFDSVGEASLLLSRPLLFNSFCCPASEDDTIVYAPVENFGRLNKILEEKLKEHNEVRPVMNLVLFEQAMEHICRITRIIQSPRGHGLLVGVGGSGKQSLARLAAYLCSFEVFQISVTQAYGLNEFKTDVQQLYIGAGVKGLKIVFLLTDSHICDEHFMVYINDLLATGYIAGLFAPEERDSIAGSVRSEAKQVGIVDTRDNCWDFFLNKVRRNLHVLLCFSPVGDKFRVRARRFPAIINCTVIDWFQEWSSEALIAVAQRFVEGDMKDEVAQHMAFVHTSVGTAAVQYLQAERRPVYITPKSFLELISLYKAMLKQRRQDIAALRIRLESGLDKLRATEEVVAELQATLKEELQVVQMRQERTDALLEQIGKETAVVEEQRAFAMEKEAKSMSIASEVADIQRQCFEELAIAEPIIQEAERALNTLDKKSLTELKAFATPPNDIVDVGKAVLVLMAPGGRIPKDLSWNNLKKTLMQSVERFLQQLQNFDKDNVAEQCVAWVERNLLCIPGFNPEDIRSKSLAAAGICKWVINICKYFRIYQNVQPKRDRLAEANVKLEDANRVLATDRAKLESLQARVKALTEQFEQATADKAAAISQMERTRTRANVAERLVGGLSDEKIRWTQSLEELVERERLLVGDMLLAAAFVSYAAPFNARFRHLLVNERWLLDLQTRKISITEGITPLSKLADDAEIAHWGNEGLPTDSVSVENGAIVCACSRWPLMIDPQLQGIRWIKTREVKNGLKIVQLGQAKYLEVIERAVESGTPVLIENLGENIDAVLEPMLSRSFIRRGRATLIRIGDKDIEYDPAFRLYLHTKLANPHYRPEIAAQCTLINFTVTEHGLEEQLLAMVVNKERPDLEVQRAELLRQQNDFKITLKELEDNLLFRLSNAQGDILADVELIENLETTKATAKDIADKVLLARQTEAEVNNTRESYRPVAVRGAILYFLMQSLQTLDYTYQYSMAYFVALMKKGMENKVVALPPQQSTLHHPPPALPAASSSSSSAPMSEVERRAVTLVDSVTYNIFAAVAMGLFERHKLIFAAQLTLLVLQRTSGTEPIEPEHISFLLRPLASFSGSGEENPCAEWISDSSWAALHALKDFDAFEQLPSDVEGGAKRWREWCELERPETEQFPGEWKKVPDFARLLIIKCLRPDRLPEAITAFVRSVLGELYVRPHPGDLEKALEDANASTAVLYVLSPGVDPVGYIEAAARKRDLTYENGLINVSLGQGQERIAERALDKAQRDGVWLILQNIHLTPRWTASYLERRMDKLGEGANENFRLFLSAEPSPPEADVPTVPVSILQSIKITNEPPEGLRNNMVRAFAAFPNDEAFESSSRPAEYKAIVFTLCLFHAIVIERKKFGPQGWNKIYPFNIGDLTSSAMVCANYLDVGGDSTQGGGGGGSGAGRKIPWDDLRYMFGEIMYGGHITDDWDRRLCGAYLDNLMRDDILDHTEVFPGFFTPKTWAQPFTSLQKYVEERMPPENPIAFGLHPNAETRFRLAQADFLLQNIHNPNSSSSRSSSSTASDGMMSTDTSVQERARMMVDEVMEKVPEAFAMREVLAQVEERTPYVNVFLQEIERVNILLTEIRRLLLLLEQGLRGDLTMSEGMEQVMAALVEDRVPSAFERVAYPSIRPLGSWLANLQERVKQLADWAQDPSPPGLPKVTNLSYLFSPQAFLTAVMQTNARRNEWPLDRTIIQTEVTRKQPDDIDVPAREGAYVFGLSLEGARWDGNCVDESKPKELLCRMPVILIKAVPADSSEMRDVYRCPVYKTQRRGPTYVFTAGLKSGKHNPSRWITAGVALLLDVI